MAENLPHDPARVDPNEVNPPAQPSDQEIPRLGCGPSELHRRPIRAHDQVALRVELVAPEAGGAERLLRKVFAQSRLDAPIETKDPWRSPPQRDDSGTLVLWPRRGGYEDFGLQNPLFGELLDPVEFGRRCFLRTQNREGLGVEQVAVPIKKQKRGVVGHELRKGLREVGVCCGNDLHSPRFELLQVLPVGFVCVVRVVGEGLRNAEIAARLFVTSKTVESTLSRVYRKLGVRSRTELARQMGR